MIEVSTVARALLLAPTVAASLAVAQVPVERPKTYALLSAMGNQFTVVHEEQSTGSHIPPYRSQSYLIGENVLNRITLNGLDRAVARMDPNGKRIYLSTNPSRARGRYASEEAALDPVLAELKKLDRAKWDRIVVAMPAYRYHSKDGLATRMQGIGMFAQPLCQSDSGFGNRMGSCDSGFRPPSGPEALTPEGKTIAANTYVAPYAFVEVFLLDAHTLAVLDRQTSFGHRKLTDASGNAMGVASGDSKAFVNRQMLEVITGSIGDAVEGTQLKGSVEVLEKGPAK
jgi:hypothetical protein